LTLTNKWQYAAGCVENNMITVTETAARKIKQNLTRRGTGMGIRMGVRTTGCSGLAYVLEYVDHIEPTDTVFEQDGFAVVVDPKSATIMSGIEIDYVRQGLNEGFEFNNPNEKDRCGCGESFRI
jgi:iron-sulfur cluster assembly protein